MKKWLPLIIFFITSSFIYAPVTGVASQSTDVTRINISLHEGVDERIVDSWGYKVLHKYDSIPVFTLEVTDREKETLLQKKELKWLEQDPDVQLTSQKVEWGYKLVQPQFTLSKEQRYTGKGIKVGVIDTGINKNHPDLKIAGGVSFIEGTNTYDDPNGHGTHVAGIIAAQDNSIGVVGIAPDVELYAIRSLGESGYGNQSDIVAGIDWAIQQKLDIVNLSVTTSQSSNALKEVVKKAYDQGMLLFAASGNSQQVLPSTTEVLFPARYENVIAVGSIGQNNKRSSFSYFGSQLEFVAPGDAILSTSQNPSTTTSEDYGYLSGTSMASPNVAGVAALYMEQNPTLTNSQIRQLMQQTAVDLGAPGRDKEYGFGLVKAPMKQVETTPDNEETFPDIVKGSWYESSVVHLLEKDIITGYLDQTFRPNNVVSRAEAVTMIGRALEIEPSVTVSSYSDVPNGSFANGFIEEATKSGWITGYTDQTFRPSSSVTRGDIATMLYRAFKLEDKSDYNPFSDVVKERYYGIPVLSLYYYEYITGYIDGSFQPTQSITRAEFAKILAEMIK